MAVGRQLVLEQTPTASQIDAYQGNANLGGNGQALDPGDKDISAMTAQALQQATAQNFQWQVLQDSNKRKDRDAALDVFAKAEVKGDIDEVDRPKLQSTYDEIEKQFLANPNLMNDPQAYAKIQGKIKQYNSLGALANTRAAEFSKQRLDIASTTDPELKKKKIDHLEAERAKGVEHIPSPFMKELDWDPKNFSGSDTVVVKQEVGKDARGLPTVTETVRTNVKGIIDKYSPSAFLEGTNKTLPNEAAQRAKFILSTPQFTDTAYIVGANKRLEEINTANGFKPGDKYYLTPYAVEDADGKWIIDSNPIELNKKVHVLSEYNETKGPAKLDKAAQDLLVQQANIEQSKAAAKASTANAAQSYNAINIANKKLPKELELIDASIEEKKRAGGDISSLTNQKIFAKVGSDAIGAFGEANKLKATVKAPDVLKPEQRRSLGIADGALLVRVPMTNAVAKEMLTQTSLDEKGKKIDSEPGAIYMVKDPKNPDNNRLIGLDKERGTVIATYGLNDGATNLASQRLGNSTGYNQPTIQAGVDEYITKFTAPDNTGSAPLEITSEEEIATYKPSSSDFEETFQVGTEKGYVKNVTQNGQQRKAIYRKVGGKFVFVGWK